MTDSDNEMISVQSIILIFLGGIKQFLWSHIKFELAPMLVLKQMHAQKWELVFWRIFLTFCNWGSVVVRPEDSEWSVSAVM